MDCNPENIIIIEDPIRKIYESCQLGAIDELKNLLQDFTIDIHSSDKDGFSALHYAAANNHIQCAQLLLDSGAKINCLSNNGCTPLYMACQSGYDSTVSFLLERNANMHCATISTKHTALLVASEFGYNNVIKILIRSGANINNRTNRGLTALHLAAQHGQTSTIKFLISEGFCVDCCTQSKWTPLMIAIWNEQHEAAEELIHENCQLNLRNNSGFTALHIASLRHTHLVELCINSGSIINIQDYNMLWTPLHVAATTGKQDVIRILILSGIDISLEDKYGNTALHIATYDGFKNIVATLLDTGANLKQVNCVNFSPADIAREYCLSQLLQLFNDHLECIRRRHLI